MNGQTPPDHPVTVRSPFITSAHRFDRRAGVKLCAFGNAFKLIFEACG